MKKCDFCNEIKEGVNVFSTDYAPISLLYCKECVKVERVIPKFYVFSLILRRLYKDELDFMVYHNGEYITISEFVKSIDIHEEVQKEPLSKDPRIKYWYELYLSVG